MKGTGQIEDEWHRFRDKWQLAVTCVWFSGGWALESTGSSSWRAGGPQPDRFLSLYLFSFSLRSQKTFFFFFLMWSLPIKCWHYFRCYKTWRSPTLQAKQAPFVGLVLASGLPGCDLCSVTTTPDSHCELRNSEHRHPGRLSPLLPPAVWWSGTVVKWHVWARLSQSRPYSYHSPWSAIQCPKPRLSLRFFLWSICQSLYFYFVYVLVVTCWCHI